MQWPSADWYWNSHTFLRSEGKTKTKTKTIRKHSLVNRLEFGISVFDRLSFRFGIPNTTRSSKSDFSLRRNFRSTLLEVIQISVFFSSWQPLSLLNSHSTCKVYLTAKTRTQKVVCEEQHLFRPFSAGYKNASGAMTTIRWGKGLRLTAHLNSLNILMRAGNCLLIGWLMVRNNCK